MPTTSGIDRFLQGILASLTCALIIWVVRNLRSRWALWRMEGYWLEVIEDTPRRYSLGELRFSFWTTRQLYNGFNYSGSGERNDSWKTLKGHFDADHKEFLYIYEVTHLRDDTKNHGFGRIMIPNRGTPVELGETDGYFMDAEKANASIHRARLFRADRVAKQERILLDPKDEASKKHFIVQLAAKNWPS